MIKLIQQGYKCIAYLDSINVSKLIINNTDTIQQYSKHIYSGRNKKQKQTVELVVFNKIDYISKFSNLMPLMLGFS